MPSVANPNPHPHPPPPLRALTNSSTASQPPSAPMSPGYAAAATPQSSYMAQHNTQTSNPSSPTEPNFFEALASRVRGRPRSRSRTGVPRNRSKSPLPPDHISSPTEHCPSSPQLRQTRHFSESSHTSVSSPTDTTQKRRSLPQRRDTNSSVNAWYGRHSNSWLFNDFSVTEHVKDICGRKRRNS